MRWLKTCRRFFATIRLKGYRDRIRIGDRIPAVKIEDMEGKLSRFKIGDPVFLKLIRQKRNHIDGALARRYVAEEI